MKKTFTGGWAVFTNQQDTLETIDALRQQGYQSITVHSPYPLPETAVLLRTSGNSVKIATLAGTATGCLLAFFFMIWSALDWILPLSAKPIVSIPVMIPIAFEVTILGAILAMIFALITGISLHHLKHPRPKSLKYRNYRRFTDDRFGIVTPCLEKELSSLETLFREHHAEEVEIES